MIPVTPLPPEYAKKPTLTLKSLLEFKPEEFGLPPFTDHPDANMHGKRPRAIS